MFYKISLITNIALSGFFILCGLFALVSDKEIDTASVLSFSVLFVMYFLFLWFDLICYKVNKYNAEKNTLSSSLKTAGKVSFVMTIITVIFLIICILGASLAFANASTTSNLKQLPYLILCMILFLLSGATAVINMVHYKKAVKQNNNLVNAFINDIGTATE